MDAPMDAPRLWWLQDQYEIQKDPNKLFIFANQDEFENVRHLLPLGETKVYTRNIVYKEIFSHTRFNAS